MGTPPSREAKTRPSLAVTTLRLRISPVPSHTGKQVYYPARLDYLPTDRGTPDPSGAFRAGPRHRVGCHSPQCPCTLVTLHVPRPGPVSTQRDPLPVPSTCPFMEATGGPSQLIAVSQSCCSTALSCLSQVVSNCFQAHDHRRCLWRALAPGWPRAGPEGGGSPAARGSRHADSEGVADRGRGPCRSAAGPPREIRRPDAEVLHTCRTCAP